jgi:hypothetical protein
LYSCDRNFAGRSDFAIRDFLAIGHLVTPYRLSCRRA